MISVRSIARVFFILRFLLNFIFCGNCRERQGLLVHLEQKELYAFVCSLSILDQKLSAVL